MNFEHHTTQSIVEECYKCVCFFLVLLIFKMDILRFVWSHIETCHKIRTCSTNQLDGPDPFPKWRHCGQINQTEKLLFFCILFSEY